MSLPPPSIIIKRKRADEPLDIFYPETSAPVATSASSLPNPTDLSTPLTSSNTDEHIKRRVTTSTGFLYRRATIDRDPGLQVFSPASSSTIASTAGTHRQRHPQTYTQSSPGIPRLLTTRPGDEEALQARFARVEKSTRRSGRGSGSGHGGGSGVKTVGGEVGSRMESVPGLGAGTGAKSEAAAAPRRFYLAGARVLAVAAGMDGMALAAGRGERGRKRKGLAVFEEDEQERTGADAAGHGKGDAAAVKRKKGVERDTAFVEGRREEQETKQPRESSPKLKRPPKGNAGRRAVQSVVADAEAERRRRDDEEALQKFATEQLTTEDNKEMNPDTNAHNEDVEMAEIEEDYVFDTYIRQPVPTADALIADGTGEARILPGDSTLPNPELDSGEQGLSGTSYGFIVLPSADHDPSDFWNTYGDERHDSDSSSEADWDSEQDDENAENYYGADYPEDEVDSADEYGDDQGELYSRYHKGSDAEEWLEEGDSDGESDEDWNSVK